MAVAVDATGSEGFHAASVTTLNYTGLTTTGAANAVVLSVDWATSGAAISAPTAVWDPAGANQSMTLLNFNAPGGGGNASAIFGLAPLNSTGNKTITISWTGAGEVLAAAMSYTGVDQTGGTTSFPNAISGTNVSTVSVTSAAGNMVQAAECGGSGAAINGLTGTPIFKDTTNGTFVNAGANYDTGAPTVVIGAGGSCVSITATDIKAASGGGGGAAAAARYYYETYCRGR